MIYELTPTFDGKKSFNHKAVVVCGKTRLELWSYTTMVAQIVTSSDGTKRVVLSDEWCHSATTLRHVKEFLRQQGFTADSKAQMIRDYTEGGQN